MVVGLIAMHDASIDPIVLSKWPCTTNIWVNRVKINRAILNLISHILGVQDHLGSTAADSFMTSTLKFLLKENIMRC
jgi:hypothetical protein